jgi:hypothetical protein
VALIPQPLLPPVIRQEKGGLRRAGWERRKKRGTGASQESRVMGVLCAPLLLPDHRREKGLGDEGHHGGLARSGARHDSKGAAPRRSSRRGVAKRGGEGVASGGDFAMRESRASAESRETP